MLTLVGVNETYQHDRRVLIDQLDAAAVPQTLRAHRETLRRLGEVYKQLNLVISCRRPPGRSRPVDTTRP
jgi:hypothetical protein